jgi:charged multivesicular body protein 1
MGNKQSQKEFEDTMFNLRLSAKQFTKEAERSRKEERLEQEKAKRALEKGLIDIARVHGENSIRKKTEGLNYLKLSAKMDAVYSRMRTAARTEQMTKQFGPMVNQMNRCLKSMNLDAISTTMEQFERTFENLDVASGYIDQSLQTATSTSAPRSQVDELLGQIAAEHNITVEAQMGEIPLSTPQQISGMRVSEADLKRRYENLH